MKQSDPIFRLDGVTRRYGNLTALDSIDFTAEDNSYISLLGPSGSGKTSLLRVIAGFEAPDSGRIWFQGRDITDLPAHERGIGFVFQNFALFPHLTIFENVAFGLRNGAINPPEAEIIQRVKETIEMVGLTGLEDRNPDQISGGQKQRVALARSLVMQPKLVLLDEPLGALDANLRERMQTELRTIRERLDVTFLHVTGSETEALAMGDKVAVLDSGRIVQFGTPEEIYDAPIISDVALFLNRFNLFDGTLKDGVFHGAFGSVPVSGREPTKPTSMRSGMTVRRYSTLAPPICQGPPCRHATLQANTSGRRSFSCSKPKITRRSRLTIISAWESRAIWKSAGITSCRGAPNRPSYSARS